MKALALALGAAVVSMQTGGGGARSLMLYTASADGASWSKRVLDEGAMGGAGCAAADLNADKRPDIVCIGTATANLKWYESVGKR
jgi:hypothetical protein